MSASVLGKSVFVGLSGGVDSAVTAYLLKKAGAKVRGVFIQGWYPEGMPCTWREDRKDAMRVAAHLGIPFSTFDASEEYKRGVIDYLLSEYKAGRTPNPDIMCNREVKFGAFYAWAREHGAEYIATGHYARCLKNELHTGTDEAKDQSYFLWALSEEVRAHVLFPLGTYEKGKTRRLAQKLNLPVASKKDSQGICFLGSISVEEFLISQFGTLRGTARLPDGTRVGTHTGALLHTLGERITLEDTTAPGPWYVVGKDIEKNELYVSHTKEASTKETELTLRDVRIDSDVLHTVPVEAQYRYHGERIPGTYDVDTSIFTPEAPLSEPVAKGQSLVLFQGTRCLGGGIIS